MPIAVNCPGCSSRLTVPDTAAGKKARCPKCQTQLVIPAAPAPAAAERSPFDFNSPAAPAAKKPAAKPLPPPPAPAPEPLSLDDDEPAPPPRTPARGTGRKPVLDLDDEPDDRPARRRYGHKPAGPPVGLILGIVGGVVLLIGGAIGAYFALEDDKKDTGTADAGSDTGDTGGSRGGGKAAPPEGWVEFANKEDRFKVLMPGTARTRTVGLSSAVGKKPGPKVTPPKGSPKKVSEKVIIRLHDAEAKDDQSAAVVLAVPYSPNTPAATRERHLAEAVADRLTPTKASRELSRRDTTLAGRPAKEIVVEMVEGPPGKDAVGKPTIVVRTLVTDSFGYAVGIAGISGRVKPDVEAAYFDSFELIQ
jgi:hypothetical protein